MSAAAARVVAEELVTDGGVPLWVRLSTAPPRTRTEKSRALSTQASAWAAPARRAHSSAWAAIDSSPAKVAGAAGPLMPASRPRSSR